MNKLAGYISLHRQIVGWEWYKDSNTKSLFIHLIISANFAPARFKGKKIRRGQLVTSLASLSSETGLTIQQVKTALKHLIETNEVTNESTRKYRVITVVNYEKYQTPTNDPTNDLTNKQQTDNKQLTNYQQTDNKQLTNKQQQYNKNNKNNKDNKNNKNNKSEGTASRFTPPTKDEIEFFCRENGFKLDIDYFINHYTANGWMVGRNHMKDWRATVRNWVRRDEANKQEPEDDGLDCWGKPIKKEFE